MKKPTDVTTDQSPDTRSAGLNRRQFLSASTVTAAVAAAGALPTVAHAATGADEHYGAVDSGVGSNPVSGKTRANAAFAYRDGAAKTESRVPIPQHTTNGDENLYSTKIGNFSKGLPHDSFGQVNTTDYSLLVTACKSGNPSDFDAIPLGGNVKILNPQGGLAYDTEGTDSGQLSSVPPPTLASATRADEAVELYWMALCRDVPFDQYGLEPLTSAAISELNAFPSFDGPKINGQVTSQSLFRGFTAADLIGPYVSQFILQPVTAGQLSITQKYTTYQAGLDYMIDFTSWLNTQNGIGPFPTNVNAASTVYLRDGRDIASYVSLDFSYQSFFTALLWLINHKVAFNVGNPYLTSANQNGFATFSGAHISALMAEAVSRALKAVFYEKWIVHRCLRPEEFGGLVHLTKTGQQNYPLHTDVLNSIAVQDVFNNTGFYLLPQAFGGGCPQHPSYPQAHSTLMGACATMLKAFFNTSSVFPSPVFASDDGQSLLPYNGSDKGSITLEGELNKLASNMAMGRDFAGVHYRSDYVAGMLLGEAVAISILSDQHSSYNEVFNGFTFNKFDGTTITV
jgi:hypothetical protein